MRLAQDNDVVYTLTPDGAVGLSRMLWVPKTLNPTIVVMKSAKDGA
jgi:hypothetical protein